MSTSLSYSEISKLNLSSQQHSVISQSINNDNNNNTVSNDASSSNNDRLESTINCHIVAQKEFEQTWDKHNSHVNYVSFLLFVFHPANLITIVVSFFSTISLILNCQSN